jgi:hypothetical protein
MIDPQMCREISVNIMNRIGEGECKDTRYCLIVWCDCGDKPEFIGGNDINMPRVLKMLAHAGQTVEAMEGIEGGHA